MALVVLLRGVNVGHRRRFKPSALARDLADFGVANVGAAGTFVVQGEIDPKSVRDEILRRLPFKAELMICPADEIVDLVRSEPFGPGPPEEDVKRFLSVLAKPPETLPPLPLDQPVGDNWEVRVLHVTGRYALSLWRRRGRTVLYPNEVVERALGVTATTRGWNTMATVRRMLEAS